MLVTRDENVLCCPILDTEMISPCSHEEADTRLILHCYHAAYCGAQTLAIKTVDTDVVVLAISYFNEINVAQLWIQFGGGKTLRWLPVHEFSSALGPDKSHALPVFHSFTGCGTVSAFFGKDKKTAWDAWSSFPEITKSFLDLRLVDNDEIDDKILSDFERFVVIMYDRTSDAVNVNLASKQLFTKRSCLLQSLPPTQNALQQHIQRTVLQGVHSWGNCLQKQPPVHDPAKWGWVKKKTDGILFG